MEWNKEDIQTLDAILEKDIFSQVAGPYSNPESLSQLVYRCRMELEEEGSTLQSFLQETEHTVTLRSDLFPLIFLHDVGINVWRFLLRDGAAQYFKLARDVFVESRHTSLVGKEYESIATIIFFLIARHGQKKSGDAADSESIASFGEHLERFRKALKEPTRGLLPSLTGKLEYFPTMEDFLTLVIDNLQAPSLFSELGRSMLKINLAPSSGEPVSKLEFNLSLFKENFRKFPYPKVSNFLNFNYCRHYPAGPIDFFVKWVNPARVEALDWEIYIAKELKKKGFSTASFFGYAALGDNAYLISENVRGVDYGKIKYQTNLNHLVRFFESPSPEGDLYVGHFIKYLSRKRANRKVTMETWKAATEMAYHLLGKEVRRAFDAGVYLPDLALRNFIFQYHSRHPRALFVDFERTKIQGSPLSEQQRRKLLGKLNHQFPGNFERRAFYSGFRLGKR